MRQIEKESCPRRKNFFFIAFLLLLRLILISIHKIQLNCLQNPQKSWRILIRNRNFQNFGNILMKYKMHQSSVNGVILLFRHLSQLVVFGSLLIMLEVKKFFVCIYEARSRSFSAYFYSLLIVRWGCRYNQRYNVSIWKILLTSIWDPSMIFQLKKESVEKAEN